MSLRNALYIAKLERRQFLQAAAALCGTAVLNSEKVVGAPLPWSQPPIYLTDLDRCRPQSALALKPTRHHWRQLKYETDKLKGTMLVVGQNTAAPELTYPIRQTGWHAIYFGLRSYGYGEDETRILARFKNEQVFSLIPHQWDPRNPFRIDDVFWKCANLSGEDIVLRQSGTQVIPEAPQSIGNPCNGAWIAYFKLIPLTEKEVESLQKDRDRTDTRRLFAHNDCHNIFYNGLATTAEEIRRHIAPLRHSDFSRLYWEAGMGDRTYYFSKVGLLCSDDWIDDPYRVGDRLFKESWQILKKTGLDPLRVAADYCHEIGLEFHASYRTAGFHFPVPEDEWNAGGVYDKHPEWRGRDRQGRPTPRLSYAYPGVRAFVISLLKEIAAYPIDGVCLLYNRRPPLVEYEPPVLAGFKEQFGTDARQLDDRDPQWLKYRATFLTQFMREVREAMNQCARDQKRGKPLEVSAVVMSSEQENLYNAMDLRSWVKEGLVDTLIPYTSVERLTSSADSWVDPRGAEFFLRLTMGTPCKVALNLMPRILSPEEYRRRAHRLYEAGVQHLFFWDRCGGYGRTWDALRRLGHREELDAWSRAGERELERPGSTLRKLGDWDLSYVTPG